MFAEKVAEINKSVNGIVWGVPMLVLIIATGIYMSVRTGFFQVVKFKLWNSQTFLAIFKKKGVTKSKDKESISQFQAMATALAGTIGTGNIAGVATAITVGGPGAVFWMWVSAFFGMMTSYSENVLGVYYRKKNDKGEWSGGAMYYLEGIKRKKIIGILAKPLAVLFALFCVFASFGIGNMTQVNSISSAMESSFRIPTIVTGIVLAVVAGLVIIGGIKRIGKVTEKLVPLMAALYIAGTLAIMIMNIKNVPDVFGSIFKGAFGFQAIAGGISGTLIRKAITMGFKRGVFSNEAGLGSTVMVNSASDVTEPAVQGMWGIFEVFVDTIIVCTLTAFTILSTGVVGKTNAAGKVLDGVPMVSQAFTNGFGSFAGYFVTISILLFAFSTVLGWSYYGTKATEYLFGSKATIVYKVLFVAFIVVGATMSLDLVWAISDTLNGLMAIPNLIGVLLLSGTVVKITRNYLARRHGKARGKDADLAAFGEGPAAEKPMLSAYEEIQLEQEAKLARELAAEKK